MVFRSSCNRLRKHLDAIAFLAVFLLVLVMEPVVETLWPSTWPDKVVPAGEKAISAVVISDAEPVGGADSTLQPFSHLLPPFYLRPRIVQQEITEISVYTAELPVPAPLKPLSSPLQPAGGGSSVEAVQSSVSDRGGRDSWIEVRLTYYTDRGVTRSGYYTFDGVASVDPAVLPHGTIFQVVGDDMLRVALDTGGMVKGEHVDVWMPDDESGRAFIKHFGERAKVEIVQRP